MFHKKDALRNFAKFTGKHLCHGLFFNKVADLRLATLLKRDSDTGVFCEFCEISENNFSYITPLVAVSEQSQITYFIKILKTSTHIFPLFFFIKAPPIFTEKPWISHFNPKANENFFSHYLFSKYIHVLYDNKGTKTIRMSSLYYRFMKINIWTGCLLQRSQLCWHLVVGIRMKIFQ